MSVINDSSIIVGKLRVLPIVLLEGFLAAFDKLVHSSRWTENVIWSYTGLASIEMFAPHNALGGHVNVCILSDYHWAVCKDI